jgi:hypothetical protein
MTWRDTGIFLLIEHILLSGLLQETNRPHVDVHSNNDSSLYVTTQNIDWGFSVFIRQYYNNNNNQWNYSPDGRKPPLIRFHSLSYCQ